MAQCLSFKYHLYPSISRNRNENGDRSVFRILLYTSIPKIVSHCTPLYPAVPKSSNEIAAGSAFYKLSYPVIPRSRNENSARSVFTKILYMAILRCHNKNDGRSVF